jgi:hypothetical protein
MGHRPNLVKEWGKIRVVEIHHHDHCIWRRARIARIFSMNAI